MDNATRKELKRITMGVPSRLAKKLMRKEEDTRMEEIAKEYLRQHGSSLPAKVKHDMELLIEAGAFRVVNDVVDPEIMKELDRYHEVQIEKSRKNGRLQDPEKDAWFRQHMAKMRKASQ